MGGGTALCSGALLAPNLVATARHCVAAIPASGIVTCPDTKFGAVTAASNILVSTNANLSDPSAQAVAAKKVIVPSGANQTAVCGNDIALLILSQNISLPAYVTPVLNPPMTDHTRYSTTVTAIGYGITSATDPTGDTAGTRRIKQNVKLTCIPGDPMFTNCYPSPDNSMTMAEFSSGNGTCEGDSGSDAYEQDNFNSGRWVGFGVLSRGGDSGSTCLGGIYTRFDAWSSLIIDAATQAAASGGYDVPSWAMPGGGPDASTDGGMPPVDANADLGVQSDGAMMADAARDATGGSGGSPGNDGGPGTGGGGGTIGGLDAGGVMDAGGGSGGSTAILDAGAAQDSRAEASVSDSGGTADENEPDAGNAGGPDGGIPIDAGSDADGGGAPADAGMGPDGASDGNSGKDAAAGKDGSSQNSNATSTVTSSLGCNCATGGAGGGSPWSMVIALGLGLGLVRGRPRRR
jgi:MYXO-CTERM domain-containing protein